jgi:hypothetical protein
VGQIGQFCCPHIASSFLPTTRTFNIHMMSYAPSSNNTNEPLTANNSEVFQVVTLNSDTFVIPQRRESLLSGKVNCSVPFSKRFGSTNSLPKLIWANLFISPVASPDGRACLAVGCAEGLWMGDRNDSKCEGLRFYHVRLSAAQPTLSQPCTVYWISRW